MFKKNCSNCFPGQDIDHLTKVLIIFFYNNNNFFLIIVLPGQDIDHGLIGGHHDSSVEVCYRFFIFKKKKKKKSESSNLFFFNNKSYFFCSNCFTWTGHRPLNECSNIFFFLIIIILIVLPGQDIDHGLIGGHHDGRVGYLAQELRGQAPVQPVVPLLPHHHPQGLPEAPVLRPALPKSSSGNLCTNKQKIIIIKKKNCPLKIGPEKRRYLFKMKKKMEEKMKNVYFQTHRSFYIIFS